MNRQEREAFQALVNQIVADENAGRTKGPAVDLPMLGRPSDEVIPQPTPIVNPKVSPKGYSAVDQQGINSLFQEMLNSEGVPELKTPLSKGKKMFENFVDKVLKHEGGYTVDQGGPTMMGITWRDNKDLLKDLGYTKDTLKNLSKQDANKIYKQRYYLEPGLDKLPGDLQYYAFDFAVNSGPQRAIKNLQKIVGTTPDGRLGPETLKKVNDYVKLNGSEALKREYIGSRANFMKQLAKDSPEVHGKSLKGWLNRISALEKDVGTTKYT